MTHLPPLADPSSIREDEDGFVLVSMPVDISDEEMFPELAALLKHTRELREAAR